ncbi:MAG: hypothetical protein HQ592_06120 [Planctomycetes bacterium]|nr:hypothetical protein [Planctomycetota bacterium]
MALCIYCPSEGPFHKEHVLPANLGGFKNAEPLLNCICQNCNNRTLSSLDSYFVESGPQAMFRCLLGIKGRAKKGPHSPYEYGPRGEPAIKLRARPKGADFECLYCIDEIRDGKFVGRMLRQVVVKDKEGQWHPIYVSERVRHIGSLRGLIESEVDGPPTDIQAFDDEDSEGWLFELLKKEYAGNFTSRQMPAHETENPPIGDMVVGPEYFRAIAKIAFHYYLLQDNSVGGDEREFSGIRDFILKGGDADRFVTSDLPLQKGACFGDPCHLFGAGRNGQSVGAWVMFSAMPDGDNPQRYYVNIGKDPGHIIRLRSNAWAHRYRYYSAGEGEKNNYDGEIVPVPAKLVRMPRS